jgi:glutathione S-transferase
VLGPWTATLEINYYYQRVGGNQFRIRLTGVQQREINMPKITIHGVARSTFVRTARMGAIELGIDHDLQRLDFQSDSHRELHPFAKMPILTDGDATIFETLAILAYLDEKASSGRLFPAKGAPRWRCITACSVALDYAYRPVVHAEGDAASEQAGQVLDWADQWLQAMPWFSGSELGAADLFFAPMIAHRLSSHAAESVFDSRPALARWYGSISRRDSFEVTAA